MVWGGRLRYFVIWGNVWTYQAFAGRAVEKWRRTKGQGLGCMVDRERRGGADRLGSVSCGGSSCGVSNSALGFGRVRVGEVRVWGVGCWV